MNAKVSYALPMMWCKRFYAIDLAYVEGVTFTIKGFCRRYGFKDNRHTRKMLNDLAKEGRLLKAKVKFSDGHYRMTYSAQKTKRMVTTWPSA